MHFRFTRWTIPLLVLATILSSRAQKPKDRLLLRKCCPHHQWLNAQLSECEPVPNESTPLGGATNDFAPGTVAVPSTAALERWVHEDLRVWDAATGTRGLPLRQVLLNTSEARVQLGPLPPCEPMRRKLFTWNSHRRFRLLANGSLLLRSDTADEPGIELSADEFCVDNSAQGVYLFVTCPCQKVLCINKCCPSSQEQILVITRQKVIPKCSNLSDRTLEWSPRFSPTDGDNMTVEHITIANSYPVCGPGFSAASLHENPTLLSENLSIFSNGSALWEGLGMGVPFPPGTWCADMAVIGSGSRVENAIACLKGT